MLFLSINGAMNVDNPDKLIWGKDPAGIVTTQSFLKTFAPSMQSTGPFGFIWQQWIPLKVSCFLWKILHSALPTNENVKRVGIPLASKCYCCDNPDSESMEHLFISGQMADTLWNFLCPMFRKQRPSSIRSFFHDWGSCVTSKKFTSFMSFGLACLGFWEIWKIRNLRMYNDAATRFSRYVLLRCAAFLAKVSPSSCTYDIHSRRVCHALCIEAPQISHFNVFWSSWSPALLGNSCNVAINVSEGCSRLAAILRDSQGAFIYALKVTSTNKHFIKCLFHIISDLTSLGLHYVRLQVCNEDVSCLGKDSEVERNLLPVKRRLVSALQNIAVFRISFSLNLPAEVLCFSESAFISSSSEDSLPDAVHMALKQDAYLHPCSFQDQRIFISFLLYGVLSSSLFRKGWVYNLFSVVKTMCKIIVWRLRVRPFLLVLATVRAFRTSL